MLDGFRLALTTLTVARVRGPVRLDRATAGQAMALAPLVGGLIGLVAAVVLLLGRVTQEDHATSLLPPILAIGTLALLTRGLHLDGLADLTDGLGSYKDPSGTRDVMKAPDVGPLGVSALFVALLTQMAALQTCVLAGRGTASLVLSVAVGRLAITAACASTPAASPDGMGALVAGTVRRGVTSAWVGLACVLGSGYAVIDPDTIGSDGLRVLRTAGAVALAMLTARLLRTHAVRRVGGLTGDVLGGLSEVATTVCLVLLSIGGQHL